MGQSIEQHASRSSLRVNDLQPTSAMGRFFWLFVWGPLTLIFAFAPLISINLLQFPSLILLPFSKKAFRQYNRICAFLVWGWWAWAIQNIIGLKVTFAGDHIPEKENAMIISNHQGMSDIVALLCLALKKKRISDLKWMVKSSLKYVPGLGWGMQFLECVFLKRDWIKDRESITATFAKYKRDQIPIWFVMFSEGTRFTKEKQQKSKNYAAGKNLPALKHVLLPRTKGFIGAVYGLRDHVDAIYSTTIIYDHKIPSLISLIRGDVKHIHCHVIRTPIADLPESKEELKKWLLADFARKDLILERARAQ